MVDNYSLNNGDGPDNLLPSIQKAIKKPQLKPSNIIPVISISSTSYLPVVVYMAPILP